MSAKHKGHDPAFTSIRILGKKAQKILSQAKKGMQRRGRKRNQKGSSLPPPEETDLEVSVKFSMSSLVQAAFTILAFVLGAWLAIQLRDKIIMIILAIFIAAIIDPGVQTMERWGLPRGLGILVHYFLALFVFIFLLISLIPIIAIQLQQIAIFISIEVDAFLVNPHISIPLLTEGVNNRLTDLIQATLQNLSINQFVDALQQLSQNLSAAAQGSLRFATQLAGSVVDFFVRLIVVLVLAFFIQIEKEKVLQWIRSFVPKRYRQYLDSKSEAIHFKIGRWGRGQLLLSLSIATLVFFALTILRMPYALTLAALAGFTEFVPYVGPLIAAAPAVLIALAQQGMLWAAIVAGIYYVIQWCENNLLVPLIMRRAVGLSPIAILSAMLVGISFPDIIHPILGILLAVPTATVLALFIEDWRQRHD